MRRVSWEALARPALIDRFVYTTITVMCVLVVYDGWTILDPYQVVGVIVGPILAMFVSHIFSAGLAQHAALGRRLTAGEWRATARGEARFLLLALPPLAILVLCALLGVSTTHAIQAIIWMGALSLGFWAGIAALRAGLSGWPLILAVIVGLLVGALVLLLQVILQPGTETRESLPLGSALSAYLH
jgi:hypothetical protein